MLEQEGRRRLLRAELEELVPGEALAQADTAGETRDGDLEDVLCHIDTDERMILHGWAPFVCKRPWHIAMPHISLEFGGVHPTIAAAGSIVWGSVVGLEWRGWSLLAAAEGRSR